MIVLSAMRRLLVLASAMVFFDVVFFSAIAPLLPDYVSELGLSKAQAGVLSASYAAGTLAFALPAGLLAARVGPRRTVIGGLLLLGSPASSSASPASFVLLDAARFVQGVAGCADLVRRADLAGHDRARRSGAARSSAPRWERPSAAPCSVRRWVRSRQRSAPSCVFSCVLVVAIVLAALASRLPEAEPPERQPLRRVAEIDRQPPDPHRRPPSSPSPR